MSSCKPDIIKIVETNTELRADKWVRRRVELSCNAIRLEAVNTSCNKIYIISPSGDNGVSFNGNAGNASVCEGFLESFPSFGVGNFLSLSSNSCASSNKSICSYAAVLKEKIVWKNESKKKKINLLNFILVFLLGISASGSLLTSSPIKVIAFRTHVSCESKFIENCCWVVFLGVFLEFRSVFGFDFLRKTWRKLCFWKILF